MYLLGANPTVSDELLLIAKCMYSWNVSLKGWNKEFGDKFSCAVSSTRLITIGLDDCLDALASNQLPQLELCVLFFLPVIVTVYCYLGV